MLSSISLSLRFLFEVVSYWFCFSFAFIFLSNYLMASSSFELSFSYSVCCNISLNYFLFTLFLSWLVLLFYTIGYSCPLTGLCSFDSSSWLFWIL